MTDNPRFTQAQLGRALSISQPQVSRDMQEAGIEGDGDGYTLEDFAALVEFRVLDRVGMAGGETFNAEAERGRLLARQADLAELRIAEQRGQLVSVEAVGRWWADILSNCASRFRGVSSRVGAHIHDPAERVRICSRIDAGVVEALTELKRDHLPPDVRQRVTTHHTEETPA